MLPLVLSTVLSVGAAAPENEVARIGRLARLVDAEAGREGDVEASVVDAFAAVVADNARALLGDARAVADAEADTPAFASHVKEQIAHALSAARGSAGRARRTALDDVLRRATSRDLAVRVLDAWFGLPSPVPGTATHAEQAHAEQAHADKPAGDKPADDKPADDKPAGDKAAGDTTARAVLSTQLGVAASPGPLALDAADAVLHDEVGAGAKNGVIDGGEWVLVHLPIDNRGTLPWFSASARVVVDGGCLFVDPTPQPLAELPPGGTTALPFWLYAAGDCSPADARIAVVQVADTVRGISGSTLRLAPVPVPSPRARLANARFDTDDLGSSDGSNAVALGPSLRAEYSVDVVSEGAAVGGTVAAAAPTALAPAFAQFSLARSARLVDDGKGVLRAGDDVDIEIVDEDRLRRAVADAGPLARWVAAPPGTAATATATATAATTAAARAGRLWLAVDVALDTVVPASLRGDAGRRTAPPVTTAPPVMTAPPVTTVTTSTRLYVALPFSPVVPAPPPPPPPEPAPPPAPAKAPAPAPLSWRVDVGGGAMVYTHGIPGEPRPFAAPGGGLRLIVGHDLAGLLAVAWNRGTYDKFGPVVDFTLDELEAELGALWRFHLSPVELAPYLSVGFQRRTADDPTNGPRDAIHAPVATAGLLTRVTLWEFVGAFVDVGLRAGASGPVVGPIDLGDVEEDDVVDPLGVRAAAGLSLSF
jgi:hypothetical protein